MTITPMSQSIPYQPLTTVAPKAVPTTPPTPSGQPGPMTSPPVAASATGNNGVPAPTAAASESSVVHFHKQAHWTDADGAHARGREVGTIRQITIDGPNGDPSRTIDVEHVTKQIETQQPDGQLLVTEVQQTRAFLVPGPDGLPTPGGPQGPPTTPPTPSSGGAQAAAASAYALTSQIGTSGA